MGGDFTAAEVREWHGQEDHAGPRRCTHGDPHACDCLDALARCDGCGLDVPESEIALVATPHGEGDFCERCRFNEAASAHANSERRNK